MNIKFGADADLSTFETVFGGLEGYTVSVVMRDPHGRHGEVGPIHTDARFDGVGRTKNGMIGFKFKLENGRGVIVDVDDVLEFLVH